MIDKIYMTESGYCVNDIKYIFKNRKSEKVSFPANCFIFHHKVYGYILYDTGYSTRLFENFAINKLYVKLNPTVIKNDATLSVKLNTIGIKAEMINYIILSHMHPDHIGGLKDFENAKIIMSKACLNLYHKRKISDLIFNNQVPNDLLKRVLIMEDISEKVIINDVLFYSFFSNDLLMMDISGHTKGQMGLYLPEGKLMLVADAYWLKEELSSDVDYTFITKLIMSDYNQYKTTHDFIKKMLSYDQGLKVISSHEKINSIEELGYVVQVYDTEILS